MRDGIFNRDAAHGAILHFFEPAESFRQPGFFNPEVRRQTGTRLFRHVGELDCAN
jgi:hypothetical protein